MPYFAADFGKRSVDATSDEPAKASDEKRRADACACCCRARNLTICTVRTIARTLAVSLCDRCLPADFGGEEMCVLTTLDYLSGLPELVPWHARRLSDQLGLFQDRSPFSNCSVCSSTVHVAKCRPFEYDPVRGFKSETPATVELCIGCRVCRKCGQSASDNALFDSGERLCARCARWCTNCEIICLDDHFQKAFQPNDMPLCAKLCCSCQVKDAVVRHPETDRGYCAGCAENNRYWSTDEDDEDYPADRSGWSRMLDTLHAQQKK